MAPLSWTHLLTDLLIEYKRVLDLVRLFYFFLVWLFRRLYLATPFDHNFEWCLFFPIRLFSWFLTRYKAAKVYAEVFLRLEIVLILLNALFKSLNWALTHLKLAYTKFSWMSLPLLKLNFAITFGTFMFFRIIRVREVFIRIWTSFLVRRLHIRHNHLHIEGNSCAKSWSIWVYGELAFILLDNFLAEDKTEQIRVLLRPIPFLIKEFSESIQGTFIQTLATVHDSAYEHRIEVVIAGKNFDKLSSCTVKRIFEQVCQYLL